jgi:hypothetical protein
LAVGPSLPLPGRATRARDASRYRT